MMQEEVAFDAERGVGMEPSSEAPEDQTSEATSRKYPIEPIGNDRVGKKMVESVRGLQQSSQ
jgi:hypothetical protein